MITTALDSAYRVAALASASQYAELLPRTRNWTLYQTAEWQSFLDRLAMGDRICLGLYEEDRLVGVMAAREVRKGPLRFLGSPLPGWNTPYMGFAWLASPPPQEVVLPAIARFARENGYGHVEVVGLETTFPPTPGWSEERAETWIAAIASDPEAVLASYSKSCRKSVRRGLRNGVEPELTDDESFVDIYYRQLEEVFGKRGWVPTYPKERVHALWETLKPTGRLLTAWARQGDRIIATRIDIVGNRMLHSFGSASSQETLRLTPNECLRYHVMSWASQNGIARYDMSGRGDYKEKFNGTLVAHTRYMRSSRLLRLARSSAKRYVYWRKGRGGGAQ